VKSIYNQGKPTTSTQEKYFVSSEEEKEKDQNETWFEDNHFVKKERIFSLFGSRKEVGFENYLDDVLKKNK